jgi:hypothetical protein
MIHFGMPSSFGRGRISRLGPVLCPERISARCHHPYRRLEGAKGGIAEGVLSEWLME